VFVPQTIRAVLVGACVAISCGCSYAADTPSLETNPEFTVGDSWTFRWKDLVDQKPETQELQQAYKSEGGVGWVIGRSLNPEAKRKNYVLKFEYAKSDFREVFDFNPAQPTQPGKQFRDRTKFDDEVQFPLTIGREYKYSNVWSNGNGRADYNAKVVRYEKVNVTAGEFDAYRIELDGWWKDTVHSYSGRAVITLWYSPEVKRIIKRDYTDFTTRNRPYASYLMEMVKWEPAAPLLEELSTPKDGAAKATANPS